MPLEPDTLNLTGCFAQEGKMSIKAADIMTRDVVTARPDEPVKVLAKRLSDHEISAMPVCDAQGRLVGMVSEGDLMRPFGEAKMLKRAWWLNLLADGYDLAPEFADYIRLDHRRAQDLMKSPVISASDTATVPELADVMIDRKVKRLPILRDGKLVGIVSRSDVVRAMAKEPASLAAA